MNSGELFTRAVTVLPVVVRERFDADAPLDWIRMEDAATGVELDEAIRTHRRLPLAVEELARRLIRDLGIAPADLAAASERHGAASAWISWVALEAEGGSYQLQNDRSGQVRVGVRPETLVGYVTLGLELSAAIHDASERWLEAGERFEATPEGDRGPLAQCAVRMRAYLVAVLGTIPGQHRAARAARVLEQAWNSQSVEARSILAGVRLSTARGARAPRKNHYAPVTSHRLNACDSGEIRWLRALAERAASGRAEEAPARSSGTRTSRSVANPNGGAPNPVQADARVRESARAHSLPMSARVARVGARESVPNSLLLGKNPEDLVPDTEVAELERVANHLPGAVQRRMGEAYGADVAQALARFQNPREVDAVREEIARAASGHNVGQWLEELASALLKDTGAQTRAGKRTGSMRLGARQEPGGSHRSTEIETGAFGVLSPLGLVEQVRTSLSFANDAWAGLMALRSAGKEGDWTLNEAEAGTSELAAGEHETLEAAREIGQALERIQRAFGDAHGERAANALEQAAMVSETLRSVGPTIRTAAGWPGGAEAPEAKNPEDIARVASVAEALHGEIRSIANRLIAGWIAEVQAYGESRRA